AIPDLPSFPTRRSSDLFLILQQTSLSYDHLRRYREEKIVFDRMLAIKPNDAETKVDRAFVELDWKADTRPLHQMIDSMRVTNPRSEEHTSELQSLAYLV